MTLPSERAARCPHTQPGLRDWFDAGTWPLGRPPVAGEDVVLPTNTRVHLPRGSTPVLGVLTIPPTAELILGSEADGSTAHFSALGVVVQGGLRAGAEGCRLRPSTRVTITLHGQRPLTFAGLDALPRHAKGLHITGSGTLDLHGHAYTPTWTRLSRPVKPGDRFVYLQARVGWRAGQQIVLATTALKDSRDWHRNEVLTIESVGAAAGGGSGGGVDGGGAAAGAAPPGADVPIKLTTAARYRHEANAAYQGEVGLLSRNVLVEGASSDSEPVDTLPRSCPSGIRVLGSYMPGPCEYTYLTGFGGHVFVDGGSSTARIAGVELHRAGQTNVIGRYPIHFHLLGEGGARSYVKDSSVHRSYYRGVVLHGTHASNVSQTVAYDITGHCFYLEDGVEERNTLEYNLAAHVHVIGKPAYGHGQTCADVESSPILANPADVTAGGFYISNAYNRVVGNAASGGWAGFALPTLPQPVLAHRGYTALQPSARPTLEFRGNSAHSGGFWWFAAGQVSCEPTIALPTQTHVRQPLRWAPLPATPARHPCPPPLR